MNQIIAAVVLFGVVTVVFAPLIVESGSQIFSRSVSISDVMDSSRKQTGQLVVATHIQYGQNGITIFLSNVGIEDVKIHTVLVDGIDSTFVLKNQDLMPVDMLAIKDLGILEIDGSGSNVQIITNAGKLFEFSMT